MTTGHGDGRGAQGHSYGAGDDPEYDPYRAAVDALADPLNDPLPGQRPPEPPPQPDPPAAAEGAYGAEGGQAADWYAAQPQPRPQPSATPPPTATPASAPTPYEPHGPYGQSAEPPQQPVQPVQQPVAPPTQQRMSPPAQRAAQQPMGTERQPGGPARQPGPHQPGQPQQPAQPQQFGTGPQQGRGRAAAEDRSTVGLRRPSPQELSLGEAVDAPAGRPRIERPPGPSRLEARRAARALRPGPGIIASRAIGEVFITCGVLMLLFVAYQLWWTNVLADQQAGGATNRLQKQWDEHKPGDGVDPERKAGAFKPGEGFAIIHIPKIDITAPIAQGVSKTKVLDRGMVGHYDEKPLKTAMPWDKKGNFALAGHRNTHGEPFRYINRLEAGDEVVVETQSKFYTYKVTRQLPSTSPSDTGVIDPVPPKSGFTKPGRYITLTTCTPEFTSKYRLIVWGKMVDERPRSKGKPDALVD
ncbi:class E sortase [Streptomyces sp. 891-h]|uniref:class E sortase n=1 Tax=Streptomyces sp. 891-h TaxID=2720714 RepID=UPI001FAA9A33|nr:class E sortase [Streptomyces sp. 891-h]UNZ18378.1 class E sortase [Streptomyces sp. 891-h]